MRLLLGPIKSSKGLASMHNYVDPCHEYLSGWLACLLKNKTYYQLRQTHHFCLFLDIGNGLLITSSLTMVSHDGTQEILTRGIKNWQSRCTTMSTHIHQVCGVALV